VNFCFGRAFGLAFDTGCARALPGRDRFAARAADFRFALALALDVFALGMRASLMPPSLPQAPVRRQNARSFSFPCALKALKDGFDTI
jgi:hypothetical protein